MSAVLGTSAGNLHRGHSRLARRCAVMRITLEAILNGAIPMFSKRVNAELNPRLYPQRTFLAGDTL